MAMSEFEHMHDYFIFSLYTPADDCCPGKVTIYLGIKPLLIVVKFCIPLIVQGVNKQNQCPEEDA